MKSIITHYGSAHRDEFLAVAIILAHTRCACPIYRREPTAEELADPDVWVIDIGMQFDTNLNNYDHHQFDADHIPECSLSLVLKKFNLYHPEYACWIEPTEILDSKGPAALARHYDIKLEKLHQAMSPIENAVLGEFERLPEIIPESWMYIALLKIGDKLVANIAATELQIEEGMNNLEVERVGNVDVMFFNERVNPAATHAFRKKLNKSGSDIAVSAMPDNRSDGWELLRYHDDLRIDFTKCAGDNRVLFAHNNGFVCTTAGKLGRDALKELIFKSQGCSNPPGQEPQA